MSKNQSGTKNTANKTNQSTDNLLKTAKWQKSIIRNWWIVPKLQNFSGKTETNQEYIKKILKMS